jgi:hypothetical protein
MQPSTQFINLKFINSYVTFVMDPVRVFHIVVQPSIADNAAYLSLNLKLEWSSIA